MTESDGLSGDGAMALLCIARYNGQVVAAQDADPPLLPHAADDLVGKHWKDLLQPPAPVTAALADAVDAALPVSLPPVLLQTSSTEEVVAILQLLPQGDGDEAILLVRPLWRGYDEARAGPIAAGDVVAVLGVDRLAYDDTWGLAQTGALMQSLRQGLLQILRAQDSAASPAGSAILLVLRETEMEAAADISRALLSHLRPLLAKQREGAAGARIHIGLARAEEGRSALATVLAANGALLQAQMSGGKEPVCIASESDGKRLIAQAMNASGVFSEQLAASEATPSPGRVPESPEQGQSPTVVPLESGIDGYVDDNMEGAIDQAVFLAQVDMPVAVVGPRGTGKLYVARIIHQEAGGEPDGLVYIDCREFRGRQSALRRIAEELEGSEGKTLVFKSPHLMHPEVQRKLARQLSTRMLADATPPRYLPAARYVALFPDSLDRLARHGGLEPALASVFAGYPIRVPPIRDRGQAVLRWAHKILGQESARRDRRMQGFTPDAEEAMLQHDWPGNISEMRQVITSAMDHTDKDWITPVDLGLFKGVSPQEEPRAAGNRPFHNSSPVST